MNKLLLKALPATALVLICCNETSAQIDPWKYELGIQAGTFIYQGDLTPDKIGSYKTMKPVAGISVARFLTRSFSVKISLFRGNLHGNEARYADPEWRRWRNFQFTNKITEVSAALVWDVLGNNHNSTSGKLSPYLAAGIGYSFMKVNRDWSALNSEYFSPESALMTGLAIDTVTSPPKGLISLPVSAGLKYRFSERLSIGVETTYRISSTDYLDGFSYSGHPTEGDFYFSHTIGLYYNFIRRNRLNCPKF